MLCNYCGQVLAHVQVSLTHSSQLVPGRQRQDNKINTRIKMCKECLIRDGISLAEHWWAITREPANLTGGLLSPAITSTTDQSKRAPGEEQREIYNIVADLSHLGGLPLGIFTTDTIEDLLCSSEEREGLSNGSISVLGIGHHSKPSILRRTKRKIVFGRDNKVRGWWNDLFRGTISFWAA